MLRQIKNEKRLTRQKEKKNIVITSRINVREDSKGLKCHFEASLQKSIKPILSAFH